MLVVGIPDHDANPGVVDDSGAISVLHSFHTGGVSSESTRFFNQSDYDFGTAPAANDGFEHGHTNKWD